MRDVRNERNAYEFMPRRISDIAVIKQKTLKNNFQPYGSSYKHINIPLTKTLVVYTAMRRPSELHQSCSATEAGEGFLCQS